MTLVDAGPLVALIDADEPKHELVVATLHGQTLPLVTTWPVFAESMHLLRRGRLPAQQALWSLVFKSRLVIADLPAGALERAAALMAKYENVPMDLADATLVALAEHRKDNRIFTLDSDFHVYRLNGRRQFDVVPR